MAKAIRAALSKDKSMGKEFIHGKMETDMLAPFSTIKDKD